MANFLETAPVALAPYVPSVDVNAVGQAYRYKQSMYDTNLSKIHSAVDNIDGLEVMGEPRKQYLQQKVKDLTTNLNSVGGADFSNNSVVNQALGMASKIYKDPIIQNAVMSARNIKSLMSSQKEKKNKHPEQYTPAAEYYDNIFVEQYLSNPDLDATYNGKTTASTYFDAQKPLMDMLKSRLPDIQVTVGPNGTPHYTRVGGKVRVEVSPGVYTYKETTTEEINPQEIENIVNGFYQTNPQYQESAKMDALFNYKAYDHGHLADRIIKFGQQQEDYFDNKKQELIRQAKFYQSSANIAKQQEIESQLASTEKVLNQIVKRNSEYTEMLTNGTPLDEIKYRVHMDQVRGLYVDLFEKENKKVEIKTNEEENIKMRYMFEQARLDLAQHDSLRADLEFQHKLKQDAKKTGTEPDQQIVVTPADPNQNTTGDLNKNIVEQSLKQVDEARKTVRNQYIAEYARKHGLVNGVKSTADAFNMWEAEQNRLILYPQPNVKPDDLYLEYRQANQQNEERSARAKALLDNVTAVVREQIPTTGGGVTVPVNYIRGGRTYKELYIHPESKEAHIIHDISSKVETAVAEANMRSPGKQGDRGKIYRNLLGPGVVQKELEQYKGTPEYLRLKAIFNNGFQTWNDVSNDLRSNTDNVYARQDKEINAKLAEYVKRVNPTSTVMYNTDNKNEAEGRNLLYSAMAQNIPPGEEVATQEKLKKYEVLLQYPNAITGMPMLQYLDDKGVRHDIAVPVKNNLHPLPSDQSDRINILQSPNQSTFTEGPFVRSTADGRFKYVISAQIGNPNAWEIDFLDGTKRIPIKPTSNKGIFEGPRQAEQFINAWSKMINPETKQFYTMAEIIQLEQKPPSK